MTRIRCDKCGKEMNRHDALCLDLLFNYVKDGVDIDHAINLCDDCADELHTLLYGIASSDVNND